MPVIINNAWLLWQWHLGRLVCERWYSVVSEGRKEIVPEEGSLLSLSVLMKKQPAVNLAPLIAGHHLPSDLLVLTS